MQRKSRLCVVLLLVCLVSIFSSVTAFADKTDVAELHIQTTKSDDGFVQVDMTVKNTRLNGIQVAFRYDPAVWMSVDASGNATNVFKDFAEQKAEFLTAIGTSLDNEQGFFEYTLFVMPNTEADKINEKGECVADSTGVLLYTFRFKQLSDEDANLEIAVMDEQKPYQKALPDGLLVMNYDSDQPLVTKVFWNDKEPETYVYGTYVPASPMNKDLRKEDSVCMLVGKSVTVANGKKIKIDADNAQVVPYIDNDRTYVPLRFISEAFGAEVIWEEDMDGCIIKKDQTTIELTFDSCEFKVNGETVVNDVPIQLRHDRTMVPVRFVAEQLGCDVYWNELNEAVVITPKSNPWVADRRAEIDALNEMMLSIVGIL